MKKRFGPEWTLLLAAALLLPASAPAQQTKPNWAIGVGGSVATRYTYKTTRSTIVEAAEENDVLGNTWLASLSLNRRLGHSMSLQSGVDYFQQRYSGWLETGHVGCLSVGIRVSSERREQARPYVEILPALFGGKWSDDLHDRSITSIRPGVVVGTGIVMGPARLKLDLGVKGYLSADWAGLTSPGWDSKYHGVKRMSFGGRVLYTL